MTPRERLNELYRRVTALPRPVSAAEAFRRFCDMLDAVEDELSGIPKQSPPPPLSAPDGRMYCPLEDHVIRQGNGGIAALTKGHRIEVDPDGTLRVVNRVTLDVEFER